MKFWKWKLLFAVFLFSSFSMMAQFHTGDTGFDDCFSMTPTVYDHRGGLPLICIEVDLKTYVDFKDQVVLVTDNFGNSIECASDCIFSWCYPDPSPLTTEVDINCTTGGSIGPGGSPPVCSQSEGCIVVIGP